MTTSSIAVAITEPSQVGEARRITAALTHKLGFDETESGKASIVVTEAANNIVKHAGHGEIILRALQRSQTAGIEIVALDKGPGMAQVDKCLQDGYSTNGTPGTGLGSMKRLSESFRIYSQPQLGTVVLAQLWAAPQPKTAEKASFQMGVFSVAFPGELLCGDAWSYRNGAGRLTLVMADGLGHGLQAADAAGEAIRAFQSNPDCESSRFIQVAHDALKKTRGAAVATAQIDLERKQVTFCGVGNIAGCILEGHQVRNMVSHNGTAGHEARHIQEFVYPWPDGGLLVMHSDGLQTRWDLAQYPGLVVQHPSVIAAVLHRDFKRGRDDATVIVAGQSRAGGEP